MKIVVLNQRTRVKIFAVAVFAVLFEPLYFSSGLFVFIDRIYDILKMIFSFLVLFRFICKMKTNINFWLIFFFEYCLLFSTFFMRRDILLFLKSSIYIITMVMFLEWLVEKNAPIIISALGIVFGIYAYISLISYLLFPQGLYTGTVLFWKTNWFLGNKNQATPILLLGVICSLYDSLMKKGKIGIYAFSVIICSIWYLLGVSSVTGIAASILALILVIVSFRMGVIDKALSCKNIVLGNFFLFFLLVFVRIQNILDLLGNLIIQLGKTITFSSRTYIWDQVIPLIQASALWGYGVQSPEEYRSAFHYTWAVHLHSYYLQILYEGGMMAFTILFILFLFGGIHFDGSYKRKESLIIKCGLMSYLLASQMEVYGQISTLFILIFMLYHIEEIEQQYEPLRAEYEADKMTKIRLMWGKRPLYKKKQKADSREGNELAEE